MSAQCEVLVVDDDKLLRSTMVRGFKAAGLSAFDADGKAQALARLAEHPRLERAVIDLRLASESGLDVLRAIMEARPSMRCVIFSGYCSTVVAVEAVRSGAINCLPKSVTLPELIEELTVERSARPRHDEVEVPSLEEVEWDHLQRVLHDCEGNISLAARKLGLHRQSLQRKLRRTRER
jgi:two-component system response regulator RegA